MTLSEIAHEIASIAPEDIETVTNLVADEIEASSSIQEVQAYYEALLAAGVDVKPLCKKRHPA